VHLSAIYQIGRAQVVHGIRLHLPINMPTTPGLIQIFLVFLKMGATAFGGNVALVAAIRREICEKRKWMTDAQILDLMVIGNVLPGPLATNVVFASGKILRGITGAFTALLAVLLPSFILMCVMSWAYFTYGKNETITVIMNGIIPCVAAIIAATAWNLYRKNVKGLLQHVILLLSCAVMIVWKGFFLTLIIVGFAALLGRLFMFVKQEQSAVIPVEKSKSVWMLPLALMALFVIIFFVPELSAAFTKVRSVALTFGSMSVTLFGGGYVFIPAMEKVVVHQMAWMTTREFTEGIAMGQITPGPIMISSVFIGWKVAGLQGALVAAFSLFVPPAVVMYVAQHFLQRIKANAKAEAMFKGVRPGVIGMIAASVWTVFASGQINVTAGVIFVCVLALSIWKNPEPIFLIAGSALLGFAFC